jgi:hypothetical protein
MNEETKALTPSSASDFSGIRFVGTLLEKWIAEEKVKIEGGKVELNLSLFGHPLHIDYDLSVKAEKIKTDTRSEPAA